MKVKRNHKLLIAITIIGFLVFVASGIWVAWLKEDNLSVQLTINYADGTSDTINSSGSIPLTVYYNNIEVESVSVTLYATLTWGNNMTTYHRNASITAEFDGVETTSISEIGTIPSASEPQIPLTSGERVEICQLTVTSSEINSWDQGNYTTHTINFQCTATITLTFSDSSQAVRTGLVSASITVEVTTMATTTGVLILEAEPGYVEVPP